MTPNICLIGRAGAGKSTVADILIDRFELGYERQSFAAPLKTGCGTSTDRGLLQKVGHGMRDLCPDFWVNLALAELKRRAADNEEVDYPLNFVVDDCRYENEYYALLDAGFKFIRVTAPLPTRISRLEANGKLQSPDQLLHASELQLDDVAVDATIDNGDPTDGQEALTAEVRYVMNRLVRS